MCDVIHDLSGYWLKPVTPLIMLPCLQFASCLPVNPSVPSNLNGIYCVSLGYHQIVGSTQYTYELASIADLKELSK
jgi:hypothetical protein